MRSDWQDANHVYLKLQTWVCALWHGVGFLGLQGETSSYWLRSQLHISLRLLWLYAVPSCPRRDTVRVVSWNGNWLGPHGCWPKLRSLHIMLIVFSLPWAASPSAATLFVYAVLTLLFSIVLHSLVAESRCQTHLNFGSSRFCVVKTWSNISQQKYCTLYHIFMGLPWMISVWNRHSLASHVTFWNPVSIHVARVDQYRNYVVRSPANAVCVDRITPVKPLQCICFTQIILFSRFSHHLQHTCILNTHWPHTEAHDTLTYMCVRLCVEFDHSHVV